MIIEELQRAFSIKNAFFLNPNRPETKDSGMTKQAQQPVLLPIDTSPIDLDELITIDLAMFCIASQIM
uniref:Uncharacterized protein n=1 Tax=Romanomermis culicivorax TaxID=13658 RepID=A0A915J2I8_ROMCU